MRSSNLLKNASQASHSYCLWLLLASHYYSIPVNPLPLQHDLHANCGGACYGPYLTLIHRIESSSPSAD